MNRAAYRNTRPATQLPPLTTLTPARSDSSNDTMQCLAPQHLHLHLPPPSQNHTPGTTHASINPSPLPNNANTQHWGGGPVRLSSAFYSSPALLLVFKCNHTTTQTSCLGHKTHQPSQACCAAVPCVCVAQPQAHQPRAVPQLCHTRVTHICVRQVKALQGRERTEHLRVCVEGLCGAEVWGGGVRVCVEETWLRGVKGRDRSHTTGSILASISLSPSLPHTHPAGLVPHVTHVQVQAGQLLQGRQQQQPNTADAAAGQVQGLQPRQARQRTRTNRLRHLMQGHGTARRLALGRLAFLAGVDKKRCSDISHTYTHADARTCPPPTYSACLATFDHV